MTEQPTSSPAAARLAWVGASLTALLLFFSFGPVGHPFWAFVALVPLLLAMRGVSLPAAADAISASTTITEEIALVTAINGVCSAGVTDQTT